MLVPVWQSALRHMGDQRFIIAFPVARAARLWVRELAGMSAPRPLVLALTTGDGEPLATSPVLTIHENGEWEDIFSAYEAAMADLPRPILDALDSWDPHRTATVIVPSAAALREVGGRPVFGGTPPSRAEVEDKLRVDAIFQAIGVRVPPHRIVSLPEAAEAAASIDQGSGTVWAGDNAHGIQAGATATRHVFDAASQHEALAVLGPLCERVRIQPYLSGIPCSIQGICTDDGVAVTRPTEMVVLHHPHTGAFLLAGMTNVWEPCPATRDALVHLARTVGDYLRNTLDWRGGFSVDAIETVDGCVYPTEINARMSAGLALLDGTLPGPSLEVVERLLRSGAPLGVTAAAFEQWMWRSSARRRFVHIRRNGVPQPSNGEQTLQVPGLPVTARWEDLGTTGAITLDIDPLAVPIGTRLAPWAVASFDAAAAAWNLDIAGWQAGRRED